MAIDNRDTTLIGTVVSVNVGKPRQVDWAGRSVTTSIWKQATDRRLPVGHDNLDGDAQADLRVHGGPDKAVYAYAAEDYRWWEDELNSTLDPGTFGENLTTEGVDLTKVVIGERWTVGTAELEVAQTRQPCFKLGIRMGDAGFVQRFDGARRFGVYLRINETGVLGVGDDIHLVSRPAHGLTAAAFADAIGSGGSADMRRLLEVDGVPEGTKVWARRQLDRAERSEE
jgi:MOSC domain-containing protein YiiM